MRDKLHEAKHGCLSMIPRAAAAFLVWEAVSPFTTPINIPAAVYIYPNAIKPVVETLIQSDAGVGIDALGLTVTAYVVGKLVGAPLAVLAFAVGPEAAKRTVGFLNEKRRQAVTGLKNFLVK